MSFKMGQCLVVLLVAAACGGGADAPVTDAETNPTQTSSAGNASEGEGASGAPSGTVTVDGIPLEVTGRESQFQGTTGDFLFCTYSDGGDEGNVTIEVALSDTEKFFVSFGGDGEIARYPTGMDTTTNVEAELDGDRARGTATWDDGPTVEFDVICR